MLYAKDGKICAKTFVEVYIPLEYFSDKFAVNQGTTIETFGLLFIRSIEGSEGPIKLLNIPTRITLNAYDVSAGDIVVHGKHIPVAISRYLKDSALFDEYLPQGRERAEEFVQFVLAGKLPTVLNYEKLADIWWRNLELTNVSFKVPSKIYELILATIYRDPNNSKKRFGETYGKQANPNGYNYKAGNVRNIVSELSTFSGIIYEDINAMVTSGINNTLEGNVEPVSPLEKIISY